MRRLTAFAAAIVIGLGLLFIAAPAGAAATTTGWVPAPSAPFDIAAGVRCDFPIHGQPIKDDVQKMTLATFPDGTPQREIFAGPLVTRVTNTTNGKFFDADASGTAVIDHGTDGSQTWSVLGPVLVGFGAGQGNLPRGLWLINGVFQLHFAANGTRTLQLLVGTTDNVCDHIA